MLILSDFFKCLKISKQLRKKYNNHTLLTDYETLANNNRNFDLCLKRIPAFQFVLQQI